MRPHYAQDSAGLLPPAVSMARARESCPARAACSGHLAQAREAKAQSLPWVDVNIWASWVTGPFWSQCPSQAWALSLDTQEVSRVCLGTWLHEAGLEAAQSLGSEAILLGDLLEPRSLPIFSPKMGIVAYPTRGAVGRVE